MASAPLRASTSIIAPLDLSGGRWSSLECELKRLYPAKGVGRPRGRPTAWVIVAALVAEMNRALGHDEREIGRLVAHMIGNPRAYRPDELRAHAAALADARDRGLAITLDQLDRTSELTDLVPRRSRRTPVEAVRALLDAQVADRRSPERHGLPFRGVRLAHRPVDNAALVGEVVNQIERNDYLGMLMCQSSSGSGRSMRASPACDIPLAPKRVCMGH